MSNASKKLNPKGNCDFCQQPISPDWDTSGKLPSSWFCSARCMARTWLRTAKVPSTYWRFDPSRIRAGPERIKIAEDWIQSHNEGGNSPPGLLLHSVRSGTGKTRVATHVATLRIEPRWRSPEDNMYRVNGDGNGVGMWLNSCRFRLCYLNTMHFSRVSERTSWINDLRQCDLLVFDDPDKLKPSDNLIELIYGVLDERFANGTLTILTTNIGGRELERRWGPQYGPYLVRRIREFCLAVNFDPQP